MNTRDTGKFYEKRAKSFLQSQGFQIIEQNWQCGKIGEFDFVIKDRNRFNDEYLVFVEVKYRDSGIRAAKHAVNYLKQNQMRKLASLYLKKKNLQEGKTNISYDVIAIDKHEIVHIQNIFNL